MRRQVLTGAVLITAVAVAVSACSSSSNSSSTPTTTSAAASTAASTISSAATTGATTASTLFGPDCAALGLTDATTAAAKSLPVSTVAGVTPFLKDTLAAATAAGLLPTLNSAANLTVFAPTDTAFGKEPPGEVTKLLTNPAFKPQLVATLKYHVLPVRVEQAALAGKHVTAEGQAITITGSGSNYVINGKAKIQCGGIQTKNATVYIIDTVLHPAA